MKYIPNLSWLPDIFSELKVLMQEFFDSYIQLVITRK